MTHVSVYLLKTTTVERENPTSAIGPYVMVDGMLLIPRDADAAERLADALRELAAELRQDASATGVAG